MNSYELSRKFYDWCFDNPEKISPNHAAIYFFAIEHCNRLGWKQKFGFPTQMAMDAIGIKKHQTYIKYFNDLVEWGFFELVQKSMNQYSANIISIQSAMPKNGKALDKAIITHAAKQTEPIGQSTGQSNSSIDKPINNEQINNNNNEQEFKKVDDVSFTQFGEIDIEILKTELLSNKSQKDSLSMKFRLPNVGDIDKWVETFVIHLKSINITKNTRREFNQHFNNWLGKQNLTTPVKQLTDFEKAKIALAKHGLQ